MNSSDWPARYTLRARWVFPVDGPPIADGTVTIDGSRVAAVATAPAGNTPLIDLGNVAIIPGLVNAHTHLEFSDCQAPLAPEAATFAQWIARVTQQRTLERAPVATIVEKGLAESRAAGTTTLGEIATAGWPRDGLENPQLDLSAFHEVIALAPERHNEMLAAAERHLSHPRAAGRWRAGLSPHAPYTVHPALVARMIELAGRYQAPVAMHLAESPDELQLLDAGTGPMVDYLSQRGFWLADAIPRGSRPLDYLKLLAQSPRALVIHGNYLADDEIAFLAQHANRMAVVYCPRTHAFFRHARYPLAELLAAGVRVAVGTDSRASNPDLSLLAELRAIALWHPEISGAQILALGTLGGAAAMGLDRQLGSIAPSKEANLAAIQLADLDADDPHRLLLDSELPVTTTIYRGRPSRGVPLAQAPVTPG